MKRRERLMATLRGEPVDRPAVSFYELNGLDENPEDRDPFNVYSHPSWAPLIELTREKSDRIAMRGIPFKNMDPDPASELRQRETTFDENGSRFVKTTIRAGSRTLTSLTRHDPDVNTVWTLEHLLKDVEDFEAWLDLPFYEFSGEPDIGRVLADEEKLGDSGIVMIDIADPLCHVAPLFDMGEFTIIAMTEKDLFRKALDRAAALLYPRIEAISEALPGRLWRVVGPEYASPPYLPPDLFREYVTEHDTPIVKAIQKHGGYARLHSHGRLKDILDHIVATGCDALDPIEPPNQGDVELEYVRKNYGKQLILFGNIEITDIENMPSEQFEHKVATAVREGTAGEGKGFVLLPSACPYGRVISARTVRNYEIMIEGVEKYAGV